MAWGCVGSVDVGGDVLWRSFSISSLNHALMFCSDVLWVALIRCAFAQSGICILMY